jgi:hypothetical protein
MNEDRHEWYILDAFADIADMLFHLTETCLAES